MPIKFACECGRNLIVPDERAGRSVQCPKCGRRVAIPGERRADPLPAPAVEKATAEPVSDKPVEAKREPKKPASEPPAHEKSRREKPAADSRQAMPAREHTSRSAREPETTSAKSTPIKPPPPRSSPPPLKQREPEPPRVSPAVVRDAPAGEPERPAAPIPALPTIASKTAEIAQASPPPPSPPPPPPVPKPPASTPPSMMAGRYGYQPDQEKLAAAYVLAMLVSLLGMFSMAPAVYDVARYLSHTEGDFVGRWAFLLFFLGMIHLAYAVYLTQLPDWSSAWVLTSVVLGQGAFYAMLLTAAYLARGGSQLVQALDLGQYIDNGQAIAWCFIMLCLTGVVAYFCGRVSIRWRRSFVTIRDAHRHG